MTTDTVLMIVGPIAAFIGAWFGGWCADRRRRR
jgi:predicted MFS family arabinose efflux permease